MIVNPRRPLDDHIPKSYMESDKDFVLNNLEACVAYLERQLNQGKCPHCFKPMKMENRVEFNVDQYGKSAIGHTACCGKGVRVSRANRLNYTAYKGPATEDDWGVPIKVDGQP